MAPALVSVLLSLTQTHLHIHRFLLASFYTVYDLWHSLVNIIALMIGVVPKLPQLHKFRLFGINKY